jgi:hypothetical protein
VKKSITLAFAIFVVCSMWVLAEKWEAAPEIYLVTSFDFAQYPACQASRNTNCILSIRFYDADSHQRLAEVPTSASMTGRQEIIGRAQAGGIPRRVYAVTVYADSAGNRMEGSPGQTTDLHEPSYGN